MSKKDLSNMARYLRHVERQLKDLKAMTRDIETRLFLLETDYERQVPDFCDRDGDNAKQHGSSSEPVEGCYPGMAGGDTGTTAAANDNAGDTEA